MYVKINTQTKEIVEYPYRFTKIFEECPNTSFPKLMDADLLADYGIYTVSQSGLPEFDSLTQMIQEVNPIWDDSKQCYRQSFEVVPITEEKHQQELRNLIIKLEGQITQRRLREAVLGSDNGWLVSQDTQITELRTQLR